MTRAFDRASLLPSDKIIPHIVPDVLYPAIAGKLLDGTTSHSGNYGTSQSDSRKYYYTDIKGSKPIRDPRIGAYFGSQRHMFRSLQLLEQETATHGLEVHSGDGREWMRFVGNSWTIRNDSYGNQLALYGVNVNTDTTNFIEIVGYFSGANMSGFTNHDAPDTIDCVIDGTDTGSNGSLATSAANPLIGRYVDSGSFINLPLGSTSLGIHTLRINPTNSSSETNYFMIGALELIAQDTTSSTTRNQIQIPSQTVVSFGSKFTLSASTPHHHPFNTKSDGTAWSSPTSGTTNTANSSNEWPSVIDTATSLGLSAWVNTSYYRPYNGGRVVKWVDENGEIKTSVNMMPPNARNIGSTAASEKGDDSAGNTSAAAINNLHTPTFSDQAIDHSQAEVAKTFHWREFGNGASNGGAGSGTYADASMLYGVDDIGYVMDDGLTSMAGDDVESSGLTDLHGDADGDGVYITFIGTGITIENTVTSGGIDTIAQNLFYGTHILKYLRDSGSAPEVVLDGISITTSTGSYGEISEVTFHQPKMPPIPEDCVILADYMIMADFVTQADNTDNLVLSKGVRLLSSSRDVFYDSAASISGAVSDFGYLTGMQGIQSGNTMTAKLPFFGNSVIVGVYDKSQSHTMDINSSTNVTKALIDGPHVRNDKLRYNGSALDLGVNIVTTNMITGGYPYNSTEIVTPIHTSHHYKSFETPFLHELIGGDRNIEQTHLICSQDGKTWDEVTRDTSYIGPLSVMANEDTSVTSTALVILKDWRGSEYTYRNYFNKDFAIAYDRIICLVDGFYNIHVRTASIGGGTVIHGQIYINGVQSMYSYPVDSGTTQISELTVLLKRGDYVQVYGRWNGDGLYNNFMVTRVK